MELSLFVLPELKRIVYSTYVSSFFVQMLNLVLGVSYHNRCWHNSNTDNNNPFAWKMLDLWPMMTFNWLHSTVWHADILFLFCTCACVWPTKLYSFLKYDAQHTKFLWIWLLCMDGFDFDNTFSNLDRSTYDNKVSFFNFRILISIVLLKTKPYTHVVIRYRFGIKIWKTT